MLRTQPVASEAASQPSSTTNAVDSLGSPETRLAVPAGANPIALPSCLQCDAGLLTTVSRLAAYPTNTVAALNGMWRDHLRLCFQGLSAANRPNRSRSCTC